MHWSGEGSRGHCVDVLQGMLLHVPLIQKVLNGQIDALFIQDSVVGAKLGALVGPVNTQLSVPLRSWHVVVFLAAQPFCMHTLLLQVLVIH